MQWNNLGKFTHKGAHPKNKKQNYQYWKKRTS